MGMDSQEKVGKVHQMEEMDFKIYFWKKDTVHILLTSLDVVELGSQQFQKI